MTFIAKCTKCGANVQIDPTQKEAICETCQTPILFERTTFNNEMAEEAKLKSELIKKYDDKIAVLKKELDALNESKDELQSRLNRRSILGKSSKFAIQDEMAMVDAKIEATISEIATAESKKTGLYGDA